MSVNCRSLGRPPTLWCDLIMWLCFWFLPGGGIDSMTSGYSVPCSRHASMKGQHPLACLITDAGPTRKTVSPARDMPLEGDHQLDIAHLDEVFGLPVKVGGKVVKDLDEAGANGFPLGLRILQSLHDIMHSAQGTQKQGLLSIHKRRYITVGSVRLLGGASCMAAHHAGGSAGCC